ncbi:POK25 protein, partial [Crypturellus undulatus]|nr:POK25 protein [Crypturellus undulatus]
MGAVQPGMPNPALFLEIWPLLIIDLKDCFFNIKLHPDDTQSCPVNQFEAARIAHQQFHQNVKGLMRQFKLTFSEAQEIVRSCPHCSGQGPALGVGVNPRGLGTCQLWQMD